MIEAIVVGAEVFVRRFDAGVQRGDETDTVDIGALDHAELLV